MTEAEEQVRTEAEWAKVFKPCDYIKDRDYLSNEELTTFLIAEMTKDYGPPTFVKKGDFWMRYTFRTSDPERAIKKWGDYHSLSGGFFLENGIDHNAVCWEAYKNENSPTQKDRFWLAIRPGDAIIRSFDYNRYLICPSRTRRYMGEKYGWNNFNGSDGPYVTTLEGRRIYTISSNGENTSYQGCKTVAEAKAWIDAGFPLQPCWSAILIASDHSHVTAMLEARKLLKKGYNLADLVQNHHYLVAPK